MSTGGNVTSEALHRMPFPDLTPTSCRVIRARDDVATLGEPDTVPHALAHPRIVRALADPFAAAVGELLAAAQAREATQKAPGGANAAGQGRPPTQHAAKPRRRRSWMDDPATRAKVAAALAPLREVPER